MPLKGEFYRGDIAQFLKGVQKDKLPPIAYTAGRGQSLDDVFNELVTSHEYKNTACRSRFYELNEYLVGNTDLLGKKVLLDVHWILGSKAVPNVTKDILVENLILSRRAPRK